MGSTARRGGDGVRYCGGRSPSGGRKDAALIIFTQIVRTERGKKLEGSDAKFCNCGRWVQSGDVGPHGLARGRRRGKESHSWKRDMRTRGREMHRDVRWPIEDGRRGRRGRVAERLELRGFWSRAAGGQRRRGVAAQPAGRKRGGSSAIQSAGMESCELDNERRSCEWMERSVGGGEG